MKAFRGLLAACAAVLLVSNQAFADAKSDAEKALVGKWEAKQKVGDKELKATVDFQKDGKLVMSVTNTPMGDLKFEGKYKVIDANNLEVTITFMGKTMTEKSKFKVTGDKLEMTDKNDKKETFTRVK
jgi:uncharacterized protein (TIGR03066 family)